VEALAGCPGSHQIDAWVFAVTNEPGTNKRQKKHECNNPFPGWFEPGDMAGHAIIPGTCIG
jgi:hypothetical protein